MAINNNQQVLDGIYAIESPAQPVGDFSSMEMFLLFIVILMFGIVLWHWYFSARNKAIRKIKNLKRDYSRANPVQPIAFAIAETLRQGLHLNYLNAADSFPAADAELQEEWRNFITRLNVLRYSHKQQADDCTDLFRQAIYWLRNWS